MASNLTPREVCFFVNGRQRGSAHEVRLQLTKTSKGWEQRVVPATETTAPLRVDYVCDQTRREIYEWLSCDLERGWALVD